MTGEGRRTETPAKNRKRKPSPAHPFSFGICLNLRTNAATLKVGSEITFRRINKGVVIINPPSVQPMSGRLYISIYYFGLAVCFEMTLLAAIMFQTAVVGRRTQHAAPRSTAQPARNNAGCSAAKRKAPTQRNPAVPAEL